MVSQDAFDALQTEVRMMMITLMEKLVFLERQREMEVFLEKREVFIGTRSVATAPVRSHCFFSHHYTGTCIH